MKILITGHKGFVGRHFVTKLQGEEIIGLDIKDGLQFDCRHFFRLSDEHFDLVIHLAAIVGGRQMIESDPISVATDLSIDAEMFNWAVRARPTKIVYFSSSAAYGTEYQTEHSSRILTESLIDLGSVKTPDFSYGWAKLTGELLANFAKEKYGLDVYVFRPFSGYGEDQDETYPFPAFIQRAKNKTDPFEIWGPGTQTRDFIHIDDIIDAVLETLKYPNPGPMNLCTGVSTSFIDFAKVVCKKFNYSPEIKCLLDKPVGVFHRVGNPELMNEFYRPKISLEEGIQRCV